MPKGLTYLSLKCVLEFLEPNRRIHIAGRCPSLRKLERSLPLHIDNLVFKDREITLNNITYGIQTVIKATKKREQAETLFYEVDRYGNRDTSKKVFYGDICFETSVEFGREDEELDDYPPQRSRTRPLYSRYVEITFECNQKIYKKRVRNNLEFHMALRHLSCFLLEDRSDIRVNRLKVELKNQKVLRFPDGIEMKVNHFDTGVHCPAVLMDMVNEESFPLREHKIDCGNRNNLRRISKTKTMIIIDKNRISRLLSWPMLLSKIRYEKIILKSSRLSKDDIIVIVQYWVSNPYEIGSCYMLELPNNIDVKMLLDEIKERFNGIAVKLKEPDDRQLTSIQCLTIPMNAASELSINCIKDPSDDMTQLKMEMMPIGSTIKIS